MGLPAEIALAPRGAIDARVRVPGSKSITNRALLAAALAEGETTLRGVLDSDDTRVMAHALERFGAVVAVDGETRRVRGVGGRPRAGEALLDVGASGTAARFLTAIAALRPGESVVDGTARMRERPIAELVEALREVGVDAIVEGARGCPPVRVRGGAPFGGDVEIDATRSSQYVSALLLVAPYATRPVRVKLRDGKVASRPYVEVTLDVMRAFGARAAWVDAATLSVAPGGYLARDYAIEPDASTAAYFFAAAAITGGRVVVEGLGRASRQADMGLLPILERMGCRVDAQDDAIEVRGPAAGALRAVDADMGDLPDAVLALAVTALFATGTTRIDRVAHLRLKESDRLRALETELRKLGADARADADSLTIVPASLHGDAINTYDDHRMAMAFALAGLRIPGVCIRDPGCVSKSWPGYFDALGRL
jgi:3-phosphoshikimate 1-carboxyvinyltransferase